MDGCVAVCVCVSGGGGGGGWMWVWVCKECPDVSFTPFIP